MIFIIEICYRNCYSCYSCYSNVDGEKQLEGRVLGPYRTRTIV